MRRARPWPARAAALLVFLGVAVAFAGCDGGSGQDGKAGAPSAAGAVGGKPGAGGPPPAMPVTVITASRQAVPVSIDVAGQAEGSREVEVRTRVAGIVEKKLFDEGQPVREGQPLYQIERAPFEIALAQARAALAQEQSRFDDARREAARLKPLAAQRAISQREYDAAVTAARNADASRAAAQARVREAELNLSYTLVKAPIDGVTGRSLKSEGSLVTPGTEGQLTTLVQADPVWVRFALTEQQLRQLQSSTDVDVLLLGPTGEPVGRQGRINFSATTVDPRLGTIGLRASFANDARTILPGQFVQLRLRINGRQAYLVPQQAVGQSDKGRSVWVVGDDGKARSTPVAAAEWVGRDWVIEDGLKDGDRVIVDNLMKLRPGAPVAPRQRGDGADGAGARAGGSPPKP
ncbi:MAG: efflux RND transporter periplasmic adaptor subunit [Lautropia sp.]